MLSINCVPGIGVGTGDTLRDKTDQKSFPQRKDEQINQSLIKEQVSVSYKKENKSEEGESKK